MSELIRIDDLKADAETAANEGHTVEVCPFKDDPRRAEVWTTFYYIAVEERLLAGRAA